MSESGIDLDPNKLAPGDAYHLLTGLIIPRPIAWVSTVDAEGSANLAPFSYFNMCGHSPPVLHITDSGDHSDTLRNIKSTGEFACNIASYDLGEALNFTAVPFPPEESEFDWAGLTSAECSVIRPPRVAEARATLECRLRQLVAIGNNTMVLGDIVWVHVSSSVVTNGRVDPIKLQPIGRFAGNGYAEWTRFYRLPRATWEEVQVMGEAGRLPKYRPEAWRGIDSLPEGGSNSG